MQNNVVFIDDEKDLCELYEELFTDAKLKINAFYDTDKALQYISDNNISLCFIDFRMPKITGDKLRSLIPAEIPCVLLTGELLKEAPEGFADVLTKPIQDEKFNKILKEYC